MVPATTILDSSDDDDDCDDPDLEVAGDFEEEPHEIPAFSPKLLLRSGHHDSQTLLYKHSRGQAQVLSISVAQTVGTQWTPRSLAEQILDDFAKKDDYAAFVASDDHNSLRSLAREVKANYIAASAKPVA